MCETTSGSTIKTIKVTDFCLWCNNPIDPATKRFNTCSDTCHRSMQNWASALRLAMRNGKCKILSIAQITALSTPVISPEITPVVAPASPVAVVKKVIGKVPLHCTKCDATTLPVIEMKGGQQTALCGHCSAWIKNLPKSARIPNDSKLETMIESNLSKHLYAEAEELLSCIRNGARRLEMQGRINECRSTQNSELFLG